MDKIILDFLYTVVLSFSLGSIYNALLKGLQCFGERICETQVSILKLVMLFSRHKLGPRRNMAIETPKDCNQVS